MLKRFLKLLKGSSEPPVDFEGSYLDHVLQEIYPRVARRLAECPAHDPLLVVVAEVLFQTAPEVWQPDYAGPLRDAHSPGATAKAPPPPPPAQTTDAPFSDTKAPASELDEKTAGFDSPADDTSELDIRLAIPDESASTPADSPEKPFRLDTEAVLQNGRVLLTMLLNNDRLPPGQQLEVGEILLASELWIGFMLRKDGLDTQAQKLLQLIEQKFTDGQFSQARLLLQLFQTDRPTLINNDRNLFYEDMILRMGIRRRHAVSTDIKNSVQRMFEEISNKPGDESIRRLLDYFAQYLFIDFHLYTRPPAEVESWRNLAQTSSLPGAVPYLLNQLPPRRWRHPDGKLDPRNLRGLLREHLVPPMLRDYIVRQLKTTYFILRAVGSTGLESYLDLFFDWSEQTFGVDATEFMSEIYNRTMGQDEMIAAIFNDLYEQHYQKPADAFLTDLDDAALDKLLLRALQRITVCDLNEVAPGHYNLGDFILDELTHMRYPTPDFAFKLHRIT